MPMSHSVTAIGNTAAIHRLFSARQLLAAAVVIGTVAGLTATPHATSAAAIASAGPELVRLLRGMALLKLGLVAGAAWFADWRLRFPARLPIAATYVISLGAMAAGPGLIWSMAHVVLGAVLLHASLATLLVLFWRDPGSPAMLPARLRRRMPQLPNATAPAITSVPTTPTI